MATIVAQYGSVTEDAIIDAQLVLRMHEVNVTSAGNSTVTPFGALTVDHGSIIEF